MDQGVGKGALERALHRPATEGFTNWVGTFTGYHNNIKSWQASKSVDSAVKTWREDQGGDL